MPFQRQVYSELARTPEEAKARLEAAMKPTPDPIKPRPDLDSKPKAPSPAKADKRARR